MKTAKLIESHIKGWGGIANYYRLSHPVKSERPGCDDNSYCDIIISRAFTFDRGDETMAFPADGNGKLISCSGLFSGHGISHEDLLELKGYKVI